MSGWREKALEMLPELADHMERCESRFALESPYALWIETGLLFDEAYQPPVNEDFIRRVYEYAWWCLDTDDNEHEATAACYGFFEDFPTSSQIIREDMPR